MIKIETDVPLPAGHHYEKYPFHNLEVGHSFLVPAETPEEKRKLTNTLSSRACSLFRTHNKRFITRSEDGGVRVWRSE